MKLRINIILLIIVLIIISGCQGLGQNNQEKKSNFVDFRKGLDGIVMEFLNKAPPENVFENSNFPIIINLKNLGAENIENGFLTLGLEKDYLGIIDWDDQDDTLTKYSNEMAIFKIEGKSQVTPKGNEELISINAKSKKIEAQSETHDSLILATACYKYKTSYGGNICVDTDIFDLRPSQKVCEVQDIILVEGQGAPVAITKIEIQMLPDDSSTKIKPQFLIHIENLGKGEVIHRDRHEKVCSRFDNIDESYEDFNIVFVNAFLSVDELDCSLNEPGNEGKVKLKNKKGIARCVLSENPIDRNEETYVSPLSIELDYGYTQTVSTQVTIEKPLKY